MLSGLQSFLNAIRGCSKCKSVPPCVYITSEKIPLCEEDWSILAESDIEWQIEAWLKLLIVQEII